jgi:phosphoglycerate-specific signal transduction histidine kinase
MARTALAFAVVLLACGCRLPEREAAFKLLPADQSFTYTDLVARARSQATIALEAFYVDGWADLEDVAAGLEQTARFLPKATQMPDAFKDKIGAESEQLIQDCGKLREAARAKNARTVNDVLQRINYRIRELRPEDKTPPPELPAKTKQAP